MTPTLVDESPKSGLGKALPAGFGVSDHILHDGVRPSATREIGNDRRVARAHELSVNERPHVDLQWITNELFPYLSGRPLRRERLFIGMQVLVQGEKRRKVFPSQLTKLTHHVRSMPQSALLRARRVHSFIFLGA